MKCQDEISLGSIADNKRTGQYPKGVIAGSFVPKKGEKHS
jgi:hypothetical protein